MKIKENNIARSFLIVTVVLCAALFILGYSYGFNQWYVGSIGYGIVFIVLAFIAWAIKVNFYKNVHSND